MATAERVCLRGSRCSLFFGGQGSSPVHSAVSPCKLTMNVHLSFTRRAGSCPNPTTLSRHGSGRNAARQFAGTAAQSQPEAALDDGVDVHLHTLTVQYCWRPSTALPKTGPTTFFPGPRNAQQPCESTHSFQATAIPSKLLSRKHTCVPSNWPAVLIQALLPVTHACLPLSPTGTDTQ